MRALLAVLALFVVAAACSDQSSGVSGTSDPPTPESTVASTTSSSTSTTIPPGRPVRCDTPVEAEQTGVVRSPELNEISGAVVSRSRTGEIWVHNDSGNEPTVFAIDSTGQVVDRVTLPDLGARDWEDIAIGPGPDPTVDYLYVADIGDNSADRDEVHIHRVPEPSIGTQTQPGGQTLRLTYPTGPTEAETLLVDSDTGEIIIAGKALSGATRLFSVAGDVNWANPQVADLVGEIQLGTFATATGGDAGREQVVIRTYDEVFKWKRLPGQTLAAALLMPGCRIASVDETQGEAIALTPDGTAFYTLSEGIDQPIYKYTGGS